MAMKRNRKKGGNIFIVNILHCCHLLLKEKKKKKTCLRNDNDCSWESVDSRMESYLLDKILYILVNK